MGITYTFNPSVPYTWTAPQTFTEAIQSNTDPALAAVTATLNLTTFGDSRNFDASLVNLNITPTVSFLSGNIHGERVNVAVSGGCAVSQLTAMEVDATAGVNAEVGNLTGIHVNLQGTPTASITNAVGILVDTINSGEGSIDQAVGIQIADQTEPGALALQTGIGEVIFGDVVSMPSIRPGNQDALTTYLQRAFAPTFSGLTTVNGTGAVTVSGQYTQIGNRVDWLVVITCTGTATSAATLGTTKITNVPGSKAGSYGTLQAANATVPAGIGIGVIKDANAWTPAWAATGNQIVLSGTLFV